MKYTLYMTEVSTTWVDRDQCPQFNTGEELKGMFCQQSSKPVIKDSKEPSLNRHKKQREILGQVFCTLFHRLMLYGTLALILIHYLKRKISKNMFFVLKCGKTNY